MMSFADIASCLEEAQIITLFRHTHPDCDALGSQWGLYVWLRDNFPEKQVYALGAETTDQCIFPLSDVISDDLIRSSLAIVCDTGNTGRIDDKRYALAKKIIKIDHHPDVDPYTEYRHVDDKAAAVCQILALFMKSQEGKAVSRKCAEYLYRGLVSDSLSFSTSSVTTKTFEAAMFLIKTGIDIAEINRDVKDVSLARFKYLGFLREKMQVKDGCIAYAVLTQEDIRSQSLTANQAREHVNEFAGVREFQAWAVFTEKESKPGYYDGSLRSKHIDVSKIAVKYGGGGHRNASGTKDMTIEDISKAVEEMSQMAKYI